MRGSRVPTTPGDIISRCDIFSVDGCWLFLGAKTTAGYGSMTYLQKRTYVHIFMYERLVGPIPDGYELDHICRNQSCCNPDHLEPITHLENVRRGLGGTHQRIKTHCPRGHPYEGENLILYYKNGAGPFRRCRRCQDMGIRGYVNQPKSRRNEIDYSAPLDLESFL